VRSVAVGIALTWLIALSIAVVVAYSAAWPIALMNGGDPRAGRTVGFVLGALGAGWWAARTTASLLRDHAADGDTFRRPWPLHANVERLVEHRLLDRRRQPGREASWADDLIADLRGGEASERMLVIEAPVVLHVAIDGPSGSSVSFIGVDGGDVLARVDRDARAARIELPVGRWRLVLERPGPNDGRRATTQAWWIAAASSDVAR
jgi:hypothetical protein